MVEMIIADAIIVLVIVRVINAGLTISMAIKIKTSILSSSLESISSSDDLFCLDSIFFDAKCRLLRNKILCRDLEKLASGSKIEPLIQVFVAFREIAMLTAGNEV